MRNHANHLFVSLLFGLHHFGGQTFYQDKRMRKSPVYKRKTRTTINHGVTQTNRLAGIFRYALYLFRQRRSKFTKQTSLHFIVCHIIQITERGSINHGDMSVKSQNDQSHRRYADQQIKKMILLAQAQSFVFQLFHHAVEYKHNAVGFLNHLAVKKDKKDETESDNSLHHIKEHAAFLERKYQQDSPNRHQQQ